MGGTEFYCWVLFILWFLNQLPKLSQSCVVEGDKETSIAVFWRFPLCNSCLCCCKIMKAIILLKGHQALIFISGAAQ